MGWTHQVHKRAQAQGMPGCVGPTRYTEGHGLRACLGVREAQGIVVQDARGVIEHVGDAGRAQLYQRHRACSGVWKAHSVLVGEFVG